jgi:hypothetical protein
MIGNDFSINGFIVELGYFLLKSNNYEVKKMCDMDLQGKLC